MQMLYRSRLFFSLTCMAYFFSLRQVIQLGETCAPKGNNLYERASNLFTCVYVQFQYLHAMPCIRNASLRGERNSSKLKIVIICF